MSYEKVKVPETKLSPELEEKMVKLTDAHRKMSTFIPAKHELSIKLDAKGTEEHSHIREKIVREIIQALEDVMGFGVDSGSKHIDAAKKKATFLEVIRDEYGASELLIKLSREFQEIEATILEARARAVARVEHVQLGEIGLDTEPVEAWPKELNSEPDKRVNPIGMFYSSEEASQHIKMLQELNPNCVIDDRDYWRLDTGEEVTATAIFSSEDRSPKAPFEIRTVFHVVRDFKGSETPSA